MLILTLITKIVRDQLLLMMLDVWTLSLAKWMHLLKNISSKVFVD